MYICIRREMGDRTRSPLLALLSQEPIEAMRGPRINAKAFKRGFLKNLLLRLQACKNGAASNSKAMSLHERKRCIKSSADVAMAAARGGGARWPRALIMASSSSSSSSLSPWPPELPAGVKVKRCSKSIARRCCRGSWRGGRNGGGAAVAPSSGEVARRLVEKRTKVLRRMVPGGELLDEVSLLHEAIDYVVHLHTQVDVLRRISRAMRRSIVSSSGVIVVPSAQLKEGRVQVSGETEKSTL